MTTLSASGFLLVGLGSLVKAKEKLAREQGPESRTLPYLLVENACDSARRALKMLTQEPALDKSEPICYNVDADR